MPDEPRSPRHWILAFAEQLGIPAPSEDETAELLDLAGVAAHASERTAAPIACWMAGRAGLDATAALALARTV